MTKKPKTHNEKVNKLVKMAFGNKFSGDYFFYSNGNKTYSLRTNAPAEIAKRKFLFIPFLNEHYEVAGKFTSDDGSEIKVGAEYLNNAERYALLYKMCFDKEVSIKIK